MLSRVLILLCGFCLLAALTELFAVVLVVFAVAVIASRLGYRVGWLLRPLVGLSIAVVVFAVAEPGLAFGADVGTCKPVRKGQQARHLYFEVAKGKKLLGALKELKVQKERAKLLEKKLEIKEEIIGWQNMRLAAAEKANEKQEKALAAKKKRIAGLLTSTEKYRQRIARLEGERVWWVLGGAGTAVLLVGGAVLVGVLVAGR